MNFFLFVKAYSDNIMVYGKTSDQLFWRRCKILKKHKLKIWRYENME